MHLKYKLNNGTRIVMEEVPYVNSISIGVFIRAGSINENKKINGISHFIEHMLFKGTRNRTGKEIAEFIDNIGGELNAFTETEYTCFYVRTLDKHVEEAIDILSDIINNPLFSDDDIENEKRVIIEEIKMYMDSPEDLVYNMLNETMFKDSSLSLPILGTLKSINNLQKEAIIDYYNKFYVPENMVISVAGNFNSKKVLAMLENKFCKKPCGNLMDKYLPSICESPLIKQNIKYKHKEIEQLNLCLGMEGIKRGDKDLYPLIIVNNVLGGCVSSRLFQKIREEKGLVYSIYSHLDIYKTTGAFSIYAALSSDQIIKVAGLIYEEINRLMRDLMTKDELKKAKEQIKTSYILGLEDTFSRMANLGESELLLGRILPTQEILDTIDRIEMDDIERVVLKVFNKDKYNLVYVGNIKNQEHVNEKLKNILFN
ncbi:MAG: insulinase family protein [Tissierellia bacterium]|nr:insulinase family protein [Tissierellia bacterium]